MLALEALANALIPHLQLYSKATSEPDTSVFVASTACHCLPGCACAMCTCDDCGSAGEEEWMDFDFSAYAGALHTLCTLHLKPFLRHASLLTYVSFW